MAIPAVGTMVSYRPKEDGECEVALIVKRINDTTANLFVWDEDGKGSAVAGAVLFENKSEGNEYFVPAPKPEKKHEAQPKHEPQPKQEPSHHRGHGHVSR